MDRRSFVSDTASPLMFNHIGHAVTDLGRSRAFYEEALGFDFWRQLELPDQPSGRILRLPSPLGLTVCYLRGGGIVLELLHFAGEGAHPVNPRSRPMNEIGLTHLSLSVGDLAETCQLVARFGGLVLEDTDMGTGIFVRDPDHQLIELMTMSYYKRVNC
jgi:catechol 2,3-dioxygenase-like lactoylglutathione lyase family enzyme